MFPDFQLQIACHELVNDIVGHPDAPLDQVSVCEDISRNKLTDIFFTHPIARSFLLFSESE